MSELRDLIARHCHRSMTTTAIPRLVLSRSEVATPLAAALYYPLLCVIAQGRKRIFLAPRSFIMTRRPFWLPRLICR